MMREESEGKKKAYCYRYFWQSVSGGKFIVPLMPTEQKALMISLAKDKYKTIEKVFADGGYTGSLIDQVKQKLNCKLEIIKRTDKGFKVLA